MKVNIHKSTNRGYTDNNWLKSWHSFSFVDYFNPTREKFGVIRVLNQEIIAPCCGFEMHEYKNLEIVLIPLKGTLKLQSADKETKIQKDDIILITAGSGFSFSLFNESFNEEAQLIQIWIFPSKKDAKPVIQIKSIKDSLVTQKVISPDNVKSAEGSLLYIDQKIQLIFLNLSNGGTINYEITEKGNLVFAFVMKGKVIVKQSTSEEIDILEDQSTEYCADQNDSFELSLITKPFEFKALAESKILLIETQPD